MTTIYICVMVSQKYIRMYGSVIRKIHVFRFRREPNTKTNITEKLEVTRFQSLLSTILSFLACSDCDYFIITRDFVLEHNWVVFNSSCAYFIITGDILL